MNLSISWLLFMLFNVPVAQSKYVLYDSTGAIIIHITQCALLHMVWYTLAGTTDTRFNISSIVPHGVTSVKTVAGETKRPLLHVESRDLLMVLVVS